MAWCVFTVVSLASFSAVSAAPASAVGTTSGIVGDGGGCMAVSRDHVASCHADFGAAEVEMFFRDDDRRGWTSSQGVRIDTRYPDCRSPLPDAAAISAKTLILGPVWHCSKHQLLVYRRDRNGAWQPRTVWVVPGQEARVAENGLGRFLDTGRLITYVRGKSVKIYRKGGDDLTRVQTLKAPKSGVTCRFADNVYVGRRGQRMLVGCPGEQGSRMVGRVHVYRFVEAGGHAGKWVHAATIVAPYGYVRFGSGGVGMHQNRPAIDGTTIVMSSGAGYVVPQHGWGDNHFLSFSLVDGVWQLTQRVDLDRHDDVPRGPYVIKGNHVVGFDDVGTRMSLLARRGEGAPWCLRKTWASPQPDPRARLGHFGGKALFVPGKRVRVLANGPGLQGSSGFVQSYVLDAASTSKPCTALDQKPVGKTDG